MIGYIFTIIATVLFSLIGTAVTLAKTWVSSDVIAFSRFFFGSIFLLLYMLATKKKISLRLVGGAIWFGVICKCVNYLTENYAISHGYSFGGIISWPMQCVTVLLFSLFFLHEKITLRAIAGVVLCIAGVAVISWNGRPLGEIFEGSGFLYTMLMVVAGIGAGCFTMAQRMLVGKMDSCNLNLSMFVLCAVLTGAPLPFTAEIQGPFSWSALGGLLILGFVTGIAFLLTVEAMKTIPVFIVTTIQSSCVLLTLLWAVIFFREPVTAYILAGTAVFLVGMVLVNWKAKKKEPAKEETA